MSAVMAQEVSIHDFQFTYTSSAQLYVNAFPRKITSAPTAGKETERQFAHGDFRCHCALFVEKQQSEEPRNGSLPRENWGY